MEKFEVHILGCGSALPTTRHNATAQVIDLRDKLYMIDCGEGTQMQYRRSGLSFSRLNHIFISHLHGDHCFGLIGLISTFGLLGRTATLHIHAFPELETLLRPQLDFFCEGMPYAVEFHPFPHGCTDIIYEDRSVSVRAFPLSHRVPCCGFVFQEKPTAAHIKREMIDFYNIPFSQINRIKNGEDYITEEGKVIPNSRLTTPADTPRKYVYCSDTQFNPNNVQYIRDADMLFHEATFAEDHLARAKQTHHSTARQAAEMARLSGAKRLLIGHYSARYTDEKILLNEAREVFADTFLAEEGRCFSL
ncbi:MAG: ribonuclease Z [Bacteroidaceae bacterium]|nr:ribonuclease Z [Bacteroidaceae bacterium]